MPRQREHQPRPISLVLLCKTPLAEGVPWGASALRPVGQLSRTCFSYPTPLPVHLIPQKIPAQNECPALGARLNNDVSLRGMMACSLEKNQVAPRVPVLSLLRGGLCGAGTGCVGLGGSGVPQAALQEHGGNARRRLRGGAGTQRWEAATVTVYLCTFCTVFKFRACTVQPT